MNDRGSSGRASAERLRILVVDGDEGERRGIARALREARTPLEVLEAASARSALEALQDGGADILLLDDHLPDMDALAVMRAMRAEMGVRAAVVVMSRDDGEAMAARCIEAGAQGFLCKAEITPRRLERALLYARRRHDAERRLHDAYEALQLSARRHQSLTAVSSEFVWRMDPEGGLTEIDAAWLELTGMGLEQARGWGWLEVLHPDDRAGYVQCWERFVRAGQPFEYQYRLRCADGQERWFIDRIAAVYDDAGRLIEHIGAAQDITDRKRARAALERGERQQAVIAELGQQALQGVGLPRLMDETVAAVAQTFGVEYCKVLELRPGGEALRLVAGVGWQNGLVGNASVGAGRDSQAGYTLLSAAPVVVEDLRSETRFSGPALLHEHGVVSGMSVVIHGRDGPWGVLGVHATRRRTFTRDDAHFLQGVANVLADAIKRTAMEEALRASERWVRGVVDAAAAGFSITTAERRFVMANPAYCGIVGYTEEELRALDAESLTHPDDRARNLALLEELRAGERERFSMDKRYIRKDGGVIWVRLTCSMVHPAPGEPGYVIGVTEDITERRRAQEQLRLLETCVERLNDLVIVTDAEPLDEPGPRIRFVNDAFVRRTGWSRDEVIGRSPRLLQGPDTERGELDRIRAALERRAPVRAELVNYTRSGERFWLELDIAPVADAAGRVTNFVSVQRDVTERKEREAQLARQAELLDKARDAIIVRDMDGLIRFWNSGAERLYGWPREEAVGQRLEHLLNEDSAKFAEATRHLLEHGEWSGEVAQRRKDGSPLTVAAHWTLVCAEDERPESVLAINTDITERVALEEQLRQSQRLEAVGQLTGGVAHDFNNVLTVILGNAELLVEALGPEERLGELCVMVRDAAQRGADLTQRLLAFARRQPLEPEGIAVNERLGALEGLLRRTLSEDIDVELKRTAGVWPAFVDAAQLEAALLNLTLNARDAMPGGGKLTLETANVELDDAYAAMNPEVTPGAYVLLAVSDTGGGIAPEDLARVFDPFFTTKEMGKGSGMGLSMVHGFVKQSGGHIKIYSEPGHGTTVKLYLPRAEEGTAARAPAPRRGADVGGTETVLVVEDDELVRRHAQALLGGLGYRVLAAADGPRALEVLRGEEAVDVLFTDVVMPGGMSGAELAQAARRLRPDMRVLYTSGYTENAIIHQGRLDPGLHLLQKPYRRAELARKLREVLEERVQA